MSNIWSFNHGFHGLKLSYIFFLFQRLLWKKYILDKVKNKVCRQITNLATTSLTTNPPYFDEDENSPKFNDCHFFNLIKVLGYSNIGVHEVQKEEKDQIFLFFYSCIPEKVSVHM